MIHTYLIRKWNINDILAIPYDIKAVSQIHINISTQFELQISLTLINFFLFTIQLRFHIFSNFLRISV